MGLSLANASHARDNLVWDCTLDGNISGLSISVFFGGQILTGDGEVVCTNPNDGNSLLVSMPVRLTLVGGGGGFDVTIVRSMRVYSSGISVVGGPKALLGNFNVAASAGLTLIEHGVDFNVAVKVSREGLGFELGLFDKDTIGLGVRLHGMIFSIEAIKE